MGTCCSRAGKPEALDSGKEPVDSRRGTTSISDDDATFPNPSYLNLKEYIKDRKGASKFAVKGISLDPTEGKEICNLLRNSSSLRELSFLNCTLNSTLGCNHIVPYRSFVSFAAPTTLAEVSRCE